ncbi:MAG: Uma2 family endonuclease, partial [Anaerolinea sp.]|nr:Uma2 family endonuclease [Anaerolinea sp.]
SWEHGEVATALISALHSFVRANRLGRVYTETGYRVARAPDTVRGPDVSFISRETVPDSGTPKDGFVPFAPTLAVEVVSPGDLEREIGAKIAEYAAAGVSRVWVVRPKQKSVTIHYPDGAARTLTEGGTLTSDDAGFAVEGFELKLDELFAE